MAPGKKYWVTVKPNARKVGVESLPDGSLRVSVNAPAVEGRANEACIEALAEHFGVPRSRVVIVSGQRSRKKLVEVDY